ncbi:hypothetical protein [Pseudoxanthomonas sacheonensis]|uniref:Uncharacterized protein n=1 Tax=Pseudoxanthomonas sacheonensis TaxID=443615 RepID=A0ABU1RMX7_9GAMM|nr:hypothetical protein [Pseudoxanthomonas sacheonensis]MDR6839967.1 hypothetical protein [Pseudoxanthomonas sacheonensis]
MIEPSTQLRERLHALPEIALPDTLWQRVEAGRKRKIRRRKLGGGVAALMLAVAMAAPLLAPILTGTHSMRSEQGIVQHDVDAELRALDQALQAAYDRGASDAEIAPMWVTRDALLAGIRPDSPAFRHDRI